MRVKMPLSEYEHLVKEYGNTTYRSLTEYIRKRLSGKPVAIFYRSKSFDEFIDEAISLRAEMEAIRKDQPLSKENEERVIELMKRVKEKISQLVDICLQKSDLTRGYHAS